MRNPFRSTGDVARDIAAAERRHHEVALAAVGARRRLDRAAAAEERELRQNHLGALTRDAMTQRRRTA